MLSRFNLTAIAAILAVVAVTGFACKMSSPTAPSQPNPVPAADITINIVGMNDAQSFSPNPGSIPIGKTVAWHNADNTAHTATANNGSFTTGTIGPGGTSAPIRMNTAGSFAYHCTIHPTMVGTVNVQ